MAAAVHVALRRDGRRSSFSERERLEAHSRWRYVQRAKESITSLLQRRPTLMPAAGAPLPRFKRDSDSEDSSSESGFSSEGESAKACRQIVWDFLNCNSLKTESSTESAMHRLDTIYEVFSISLVLFVVVLDILGSVDDLQPFMVKFGCVQIFAGIVFTIEYVLRLWSCMESMEFSASGPICGRLKWACRPLAFADFAVVAGFLAGQISGSSGHRGVQALRMVRLLRLFALFKVDRRSNSFSIIFQVFASKKNELFATLSTALVLMVIAATMMYYIEKDANPEKFSSVPESMWWATAAFTTVGYGDSTPVTRTGQLFGGCVAIFGIALFALPAAILGSAYDEVLRNETGNNGLRSGESSQALGKPSRATTELMEQMNMQISRLADKVQSLQMEQAEFRAAQDAVLERVFRK